MARVVARCGKTPEFAFQCSKTWAELASISGCRNSKFCNDCRKPVFLVKDDAGFADALDKGLCVAIDVQDEDDGVIRLVGYPSPS
jgi:hypothetical protein